MQCYMCDLREGLDCQYFSSTCAISLNATVPDVPTQVPCPPVLPALTRDPEPPSPSSSTYDLSPTHCFALQSALKTDLGPHVHVVIHLALLAVLLFMLDMGLVCHFGLVGPEGAYGDSGNADKEGDFAPQVGGLYMISGRA